MYYGGSTEHLWTPVEALRREDADVSIVFMTANSIAFNGMVHDPFFAADQICTLLTFGDQRTVNYCGTNYSTILFRTPQSNPKQNGKTLC